MKQGGKRTLRVSTKWKMWWQLLSLLQLVLETTPQNHNRDRILTSLISNTSQTGSHQNFLQGLLRKSQRGKTKIEIDPQPEVQPEWRRTGRQGRAISRYITEHEELLKDNTGAWGPMIPLTRRMYSMKHLQALPFLVITEHQTIGLTIRGWDENHHLQIRGHGSQPEKGGCLLRVKEEILPQVEEFKYLGVLFKSEERMEQEIDRRIGAASAVMRTLHQLIFIPTLTYGHELWVMTEGTRSRVQAAEMSFLRRVTGLSLRDRVKSSAIREELGVEPLLLRVERSQMRWLGHLVSMPPGCLPGEVFRACPWEDPGHVGETMSLNWSGNAWGSPWMSWKK
ncbi:hypothetical protein D4764_05G0010470 [Takifugu flavidus]|uniref:Uncharacterized protein n=1 Tax=Takifugu flavidus TaxID=433684 RepID=A0A5C6N5H1_9TELE|nr:hypothetical protein D4764_05G0010470 [Takifugu flavidus]